REMRSVIVKPAYPIIARKKVINISGSFSTKITLSFYGMFFIKKIAVSKLSLRKGLRVKQSQSLKYEIALYLAMTVIMCSLAGVFYEAIHLFYKKGIISPD